MYDFTDRFMSYFDFRQSETENPWQNFVETIQNQFDEKFCPFRRFIFKFQNYLLENRLSLVKQEPFVPKENIRNIISKIFLLR